MNLVAKIFFAIQAIKTYKQPKKEGYYLMKSLFAVIALLMQQTTYAWMPSCPEGQYHFEDGVVQSDSNCPTGAVHLRSQHLSLDNMSHHYEGRGAPTVSINMCVSLGARFTDNADQFDEPQYVRGCISMPSGYSPAVLSARGIRLPVMPTLEATQFSSLE